MPSQTQKALVVNEIGKPLSLVTDHPVPEPAPSQLQIRVTVAGLNPHDQKCRDFGLLIADRLPAILAADVVGEVIAVGSDVTRFSIGDRVVSQGYGLQEITVLDERLAAKIPDGISQDEAATLPINIVTCMLALFHDTGLAIPPPWSPEAMDFDYAGTTILIIGGGSNCGRFGVQLAALSGIGHIVVVGGDEAELKSYGATHVVDRHGSPEALLNRIRAIVGDDLLYAFDTVNPPASQNLAVNALSCTKRGKLARLLSRGVIDETQISPPKEAGYDLRNIYGSAHAFPEINEIFWRELPRYLVEGKIKASRFEVVNGLDAELVNGVLDRYRDGDRVVKPHVHIA